MLKIKVICAHSVSLIEGALLSLSMCICNYSQYCIIVTDCYGVNSVVQGLYVSTNNRTPVTDEQLTAKEKDLDQHDKCSKLSLLFVMEVT